MQRSYSLAWFTGWLALAGCAVGDPITSNSSGPDEAGLGAGPTTGGGGVGGAIAGGGGIGGMDPTTTTGGAGAVGGAGNAGGTAPTGGAGGDGGSGGAPPVCGDGILNGTEDCDDDELGGANCQNVGQGFVGGTLGCDDVTCTFDTSACTSPPNCGNGTIQAGESCDGLNLAGATCATFGQSSGTLSCTAGCTFNTTGCYTCGNGVVQGPEVCDGANLGGQTCLSLGHDGGTLLCTGGCMALSEASCTDCPDGVVEGAEVCDGANLSGQTCATQGFLSGNLACNGACSGFVTNACVPYQCADGADNDGDGFVDGTDPGCTTAQDNAENVFSASCGGLGGPVLDISDADTSADIVVTGTTVGFPNNHQPTDFTDDCLDSEGNGPEVVLFYRNTTFKNGVVFSLDNPGTNFDSMLYIRQASCATGFTVELCNDDNASNPVFTVKSELWPSVNLPPGDYFIFVDGWNASSQGTFELTIDMP